MNLRSTTFTEKQSGFVYGLVFSFVVFGIVIAVRSRVPLSPVVEAGAAPGTSTECAPATITRMMLVTAFCSGKCCCSAHACGLTASGFPVTVNGGCFVAADRSIPFGTWVSVPGYNDGKPVPVLDRGGAIKGNRLDVYFPDHQMALKWGRQMLKVQIGLEAAK
jgi:3D (Asp-Asp-Asp) domain-containing protein